MQLGIVGLGRMGQIVLNRVFAADHDVVAFDVDETARNEAGKNGATTVETLPELASQLAPPRRIWVIVPAGDPVDAALDELAPHLHDDDIIVDGGNSHFEDSIQRADRLDATYLDCGTSGGPAAADRGFSLTVGGSKQAYSTMEPVFDAIATGPNGHNHMGPAGAGHYVKMVHNGIEYALMQAYGEGFELLHNGRYDLDLTTIAETWNNGAVIRSWLLELCADAFREEGNGLDSVADYIGGGSTGTWTVREALVQEVPVPLIYGALAERFASRRTRFARRLANRLRYGFGRHDIHRVED